MTVSGSKSSNTHFALAVDIGGTKMAAAVIDIEGKVVEDFPISAVPVLSDGKADSGQMVEWIHSNVKKSPFALDGIGIGICGNVDEETGFVPLSANLHWSRVPFGQMVQNAVELPVMAATDVRMATLAEAVWGAARGINYFAWVTIGTGYGGYLFLDGKLYRGYHGYAGNFGHNTWDENEGVMCGCGKKGCVETYVSGPGITRVGSSMAASVESGFLHQHSLSAKVDSRVVFLAAEQGDMHAQAVLDEVQRLTAISLAGLVNTLDLQMIVIGGGIAGASPYYVENLSKKIRAYLMTEEAKRDLLVVRESFSNASLIGAACDVFLRKGILSLSEGSQHE